jgi:cytochrome c biogenesis protein CcmG, thiol:disulfide interchange protein DsbE
MMRASKGPHWSEIRPAVGPVAAVAAVGVENSAMVGNSTSSGGGRSRKLRIRRKFERGRSSRRGWLAALAVLVIVLAGCSGSPALNRPSAPAESPTEAVPSPESTVDLVAMKKAAGIADCPKSDPDVAAVPSGLPDVVLSCLGGGREVRLAGLRGKPMMINIWAQWCEPCREEAPYLAEVAAADNSDLMIMGIDHADPRPDLAIEFAQLSTWTYPQLADPDVVLRAELQITGPPQTFFIRPDGTIAYRHAGPFSSAEEIRDAAQKYLGVTP